MPSDPRFRNKVFDSGSIGAYADAYVSALSEALRAVDKVALKEAVALIETAGLSGAHIYAIGNGGSAAIADHLCCDWTKGTHVKGKRTIACTSLTANVPLYSAIANDFGFDKVFTTQVEFFGSAGDILVAISSSGNSPNIVQAVETARVMRMKSIGLSGFSGGTLAKSCDVSLHVPADNYGIVEDAHQALMHIMAQFMAHRRDRG